MDVKSDPFFLGFFFYLTSVLLIFCWVPFESKMKIIHANETYKTIIEDTDPFPKSASPCSIKTGHITALDSITINTALLGSLCVFCQEHLHRQTHSIKRRA